MEFIERHRRNAPARIKEVLLAVTGFVFIVVRLSQEMATPCLSKDGATSKSSEEKEAKSIEHRAQSIEQRAKATNRNKEDSSFEI
jgi:hypothetical protein